MTHERGQLADFFGHSVEILAGCMVIVGLLAAVMIGTKPLLITLGLLAICAMPGAWNWLARWLREGGLRG